MFRSTLSAASLALLASLSLPAQGPKLQATIPFEFHMGAAVLPAGAYLITHTTSALIVRGQYPHPKSAIVIVNHMAVGNQGMDDKLVFHRYGDEYFLSSVWRSASGSSLVLPKSRREKELAAATRPSQRAEIALRQ